LTCTDLLDAPLLTNPEETISSWLSGLIDPDRGAQRIPTIDDTEVYVQFRVTEPLLLSPYIFGSGEGKQGFYGIQTMNYQMNMLSNANRAWRTGESDFQKTCLVESFEDSTLYFQFLTPHASEMLEARNVVPYYEFPVYRTTNFATIQGIGNGFVQPDGTVGTSCRSQQYSHIELLQHPTEWNTRQASHLCA
jgi:hypothetical protein